MISARTKIVATLGPSSESLPILSRLLKGGADVIRLNFAHGTEAEHLQRIRNIRKVAQEVGAPVGILQDLPGPKIRVAPSTQSPFRIKQGDDVKLVCSEKKSAYPHAIPISYQFLTRDLKAGHSIFIADGVIRLTVRSATKDVVVARVTQGGTVRSGNGVNLPDSSLSLHAFTKADQKHLAFGLDNGVDFVGISFVEDGKDLDRVRAFCRKRGKEPFLIAKIERRQALKNLEELVTKCDGVMVARGDLGVEVAFQEIPGLQRLIVDAAHKRGKPVIIATQVLESMIHSPRPTRAEATDVANAVREEADAIMLSGETAAGSFPVEAVQALSDVIKATERDVSHSHLKGSLDGFDSSDIVAHEACDIAKWIKASLIVVPTHSGLTAVRISRFRPSVPVLALVNNETMRRRLALYWGIETVPMPKPVAFHNAYHLVRTYLLKKSLVKPGQTVVLVSGAPGLPVGETGNVQLLKVGP